MENKKYKIIGKIEILTEEGEKTGKFLKKGSIEEVPEEIGAEWVEKGLAEVCECETEDNTKKEKITRIEVYNNDNQVVRVYTLDEHGKDFMKLAKEYADKFSFFIR